MERRCIVLWLVAVLLSGTARAATYYVDQNHPSASDGNAGGAASPFRTIQRGVNAAGAGDTVWVKRGVYEESVTVSSTANVNGPTLLAAWSNDSVRIGSVLRDTPAPAAWQPVPGTLNWSATLPQAASNDLVVLLDGRAIVTVLSDAPPADADMNWATYRAADRTLMVNVGGGNPALGHTLQLARNFTALRTTDAAVSWKFKSLEIGWCGIGFDIGGTWIQLEDIYFHDTWRHGIWLRVNRANINRCNFLRCGYAIGGDNAGPLNVIEQCLIVQCGQTWQEDILLRQQNQPEERAAVDFRGVSDGQVFRYNIVADNRGAGLSHSRCGATYIQGNAFWDNGQRTGLRNLLGTGDTLIHGNYLSGNDAVVQGAARAQIAENFFAGGGVVWRNDAWPQCNSYGVVRANAFVAPPAGYLCNVGSLDTQPAFSSGFRNCLVDFNRVQSAPGVPPLTDGVQAYGNRAAIQAAFGWEVHGQEPAAGLTPTSMGGGEVTFRLPWGPRTHLARPMLADLTAGDWPAAAENFYTTRPPAFFWHIADGNADNWAFMPGYAPWWYPRMRWQSRVNPAYSGTGSWWCFIDAEAVYPDPNFGVGGDIDTRSSFSIGNRWMGMSAESPTYTPASGAGYWTPWLATAPGVTSTVALKLRGVNLVAAGENAAVVWVEFRSATGQNKQRRFLVGRDDAGQWQRQSLASGSYDWTSIVEAVVAPSNAVRMALFVGMLPCTGEFDFDDVSFQTASAAAPSFGTLFIFR